MFAYAHPGADGSGVAERNSVDCEQHIVGAVVPFHNDWVAFLMDGED